MLRLRNFMQVACMATVVLTAFGCSQEEFETNRRKGDITITASFEGAGGANTRTKVDEQYRVLWEETDALALFDTEGTKIKLNHSSGTGTTATFEGVTDAGNSSTQSFSVYPYQEEGMSVSGKTLTMTLPAILADYKGSSNGPMYAKVTNPDDLNALSFKHMAALIMLKVNNIPAEATTFKITASNNIAGTCTADLTVNEPILTITDDGNASKTITATFSASAEITSRGFYIPLPVGSYESITAQLTNGGDKVYFTKTLNDKDLKRKDLLMFPALDCIEVTATTPNELNAALGAANLPQTTPDAEMATTIAVNGELDTTSGAAAIAIPVVQKSNINLLFSTLPKTGASAPLKLEDKNNGQATDPAETSTNSVSLAIPEAIADQEAPSVEIAMANSTVTLAAVGEKATYNEVTATTAKQTLIIDAGVTVKKLTVKGGNLNVNGKIEELVFDAPEGTTIYITKGTGAVLPAEIPTGFIVMDNVAVLKKALAEGGDYQLTTDTDIRGLNITIPEGITTTLDLNGHTLTADNSVSGNILVLGTLTLKDTNNSGKIVASGDYSPTCSSGLIYISGENASMTMKSGTINAVREDAANKGQFGVCVYDGGDFTMEGGKIEAGWYAVAGNGNYKTQNSIIKIKGGELISTADYAVYLPQAGETTISGDARITGACGGIGMRSGSLEITGNAQITSKGTGSTGDWKNGTGNTGNAVISIGNGSQNTYGPCAITIKGGTFTAEGNATVIAKRAEANHSIDININGGTFSDPTALTYLKEDANVNVNFNKGHEISELYIAKGQTATMDLAGNKLTVKADKVPETITVEEKTKQNLYVFISGNLTLKNGNVENNKKGMALTAPSAKLELDEITYTTTDEKHNGIFNDPNIEGSSITVKGSTITSVYYGISTNALTNPVGRTTITLENSTFIAKETALMVNIPATVTATGCTFKGGWQGVFLRGGTATFTNSSINLFFEEDYVTSNIERGNTWNNGNQAPAAALTAGNRSSNNAYNYKTEITLKNTTFSRNGTDKGGKNAADYPAIYIDTENDQTEQGVKLTYDEELKKSLETEGGLVIGNTYNVTVNDQPQ